MNGHHSEQPPQRDKIYLISGLSGQVCGGTLVMGGSRAEKRMPCCRCHQSFALYGEAVEQSNAVLIIYMNVWVWQE